MFFNQEYRKNSLHRGEIYIFYGKVEGQRRHRLVNPLLEPEGHRQLTGRITPIYPLIGGHQPADADAGRRCGRGWTPAGGAAAGRTAGCGAWRAAPASATADYAYGERPLSGWIRRGADPGPAAAGCSRSCLSSPAGLRTLRLPRELHETWPGPPAPRRSPWIPFYRRPAPSR
ncbi:MAG: hypothetical protein ACLU38_15690 [Dysosmobacter sp.]